MAVVIYVPSRLGEDWWEDLPVPLVGDNGKAVTYDHGTGAFVYTPFEAAGAVATHVALADPHTQYELETNNTAAAILTKILTVDGAGSGLDADLLDGNSSAAFLLATGATTGATSQAQTFTNGINGGIAANDDITINGTSHATKTSSYVLLQPSGGNVGIGTSTPTYAMDVNGTINSATGTYRAQQEVFVSYAGVGNPLVVGTAQATDTLELRGGGSARIQIATTGYVGIGVTGALTKLQVGPSTSGLNLADSLTAITSLSTNGLIGVTGGGGTAPFDQVGNLIYVARQTNNDGRSNHIFYTNSPSAERMRIANSGYVGIGVTAPTALLHVAASTTARASVCVPHGSAPTSPVNGDIWTDTSAMYVRINGVTKTIAFV